MRFITIFNKQDIFLNTNEQLKEEYEQWCKEWSISTKDLIIPEKKRIRKIFIRQYNGLKLDKDDIQFLTSQRNHQNYDKIRNLQESFVKKIDNQPFKIEDLVTTRGSKTSAYSIKEIIDTRECLYCGKEILLNLQQRECIYCGKESLNSESIIKWINQRSRVISLLFSGNFRKIQLSEIDDYLTEGTLCKLERVETIQVKEIKIRSSE